MNYAEKLKNPLWQRKRLGVMERDDFMCRDCLSGEKTLSVHHCHYAKGHPWETPNSLLITVCDSCHKRRGELETYLKQEFARVLAQLSPDQLEVLKGDFKTARRLEGPEYDPNDIGETYVLGARMIPSDVYDHWKAQATKPNAQ